MRFVRLMGALALAACAVTAASSARELGQQVRLALQETKTIELRLDWLRSDSERARFLRWLPRHKPKEATFIATCRRREGGGKFVGDAQQELYWLTQAREDHLTCVLAAALEVDASFRAAYESRVLGLLADLLHERAFVGGR